LRQKQRHIREQDVVLAYQNMVPVALFGNLNAPHVAHAAADGATRRVLNGIKSFYRQVRHAPVCIFESIQLRFHVLASVRARLQIDVERVPYVMWRVHVHRV
jgi:hypothetical protein